MELLTSTIRNAFADGGLGVLDLGSGSNPTMDILTSADAVLMSIDLNATAAFGDAVAGVATANAPVSGGGAWATFSQNPGASGTAAKAVLKDKDGTAHMELTVGTGAAEVNFDTLTFDTAVAATTTTAPTVTMPAS